MYFWAVLIGCGFMWLIPKVKSNNCSKDCQSCTHNESSTICTSCSNGYRPSGYSCQSCSSNCATCSEASFCSTCKPGFYGPTSACETQCPTNCLEGLCDELTGYCTECPSERYGHYCDFDCKRCKNDQCNLRQCTDGCKSGYWQYQGNYTNCRPFAENCVSCVNGSICDKCKIGTFAIYSNTRNYCIQCPSTCEQCSTFTSCSACKPGNYGTACEFNCTADIADCQQCEWDRSLTVTCIHCYNAWTLQDNKCVEVPHQCPVNCKSCSGDNVCEICMAGWAGALCNAKCHMLHCVACHEADGSILCDECDEGYGVINSLCRATSTNSNGIQPTSTASTLASTQNTTVRSTFTTPTDKSTETIKIIKKNKTI